jgi:HEAT repeat protein
VLLSVVAALATVALRARYERKAAERAVIEERWTPLLLDILSGELSPGTLAAELGPGELPYFTDFVGRFVRRLAGPEQERLIALAEPLLPELRRALRVRSPERRAVAVDTLGLLAPSAGSEELLAALDDPSPLVAMVAARALTRSGRVDHVDRLLSRLPRFQDWRPSYLSAMLTALGPAAVPALLRTFGDGTTPVRVRVVTADALSRLNAAVAADAAAALLAGPVDPELGAAALRLLGRVGHGVHLPVVREALRSEAEAMRLAAARALASLGDDREIPLLVRALDDPSRWVAEQAARGLLVLNGRPHLEALAAGRSARTSIAIEVLGDRPA